MQRRMNGGGREGLPATAHPPRPTPPHPHAHSPHEHPHPLAGVCPRWPCEAWIARPREPPSQGWCPAARGARRTGCGSSSAATATAVGGWGGVVGLVDGWRDGGGKAFAGHPHTHTHLPPLPFTPPPHTHSLQPADGGDGAPRHGHRQPQVSACAGWFGGAPRPTRAAPHAPRSHPPPTHTNTFTPPHAQVCDRCKTLRPRAGDCAGGWGGGWGGGWVGGGEGCVLRGGSSFLSLAPAR